MLTAEMAYNNVGGLGIVALQGAIAYNTWLQTFETTAGDGFDAIDDTTVFWVTKMGSGNANAPWGTLADWKAGIVANDPEPDGLAPGVINGDCPIVKLEIEVDNWVVDSEVYFDDLAINGILYPLPSSDLVGLPGVPQGTRKVYTCPNRYFGAVADDNTAFQFAAEIAVGDLYLIALPMKNASENELVAKITLNVPDCIEVEVVSADQIHGEGNVTEAVRIGLNSWKITVLPDAEYNAPVDNLYIAVQADDYCAPGYYTITGEFVQIPY